MVYKFSRYKPFFLLTMSLEKKWKDQFIILKHLQIADFSFALLVDI